MSWCRKSDLLINGILTGFNEALTLEFVIQYVILYKTGDQKINA